jgi:hypothetical protein
MPGRQSVYACGLWPLKRGASGEVSAYEQAGCETNEADQGGVPPAWLSGTFVVGWLQAFLLLHSQLGFMWFRGQFSFSTRRKHILLRVFMRFEKLFESLLIGVFWL